MFYDVMGTPSTVVVDKEGNELMSWRGTAPDRQAILHAFEE
jgi:hypothetical protein